VKKKLFSWLKGAEVRLEPGVKRIPAKEFSLAIDAKELVKKIEEESEAFKEESLLEAKQAKEKGYEEGFQEALVSLNKHLFAIDDEFKKLRGEVQRNILPLALKAARKLIGEELKLHPDRIVEIVLTSLKPVTQHKKITIYVNKSDLPILEEQKSKLKKAFEHLESLSLQERDDIEPGGCMIETEAGIINAQLENQWRALESAFESFMHK
jgi:type III secretion protein L